MRNQFEGFPKIGIEKARRRKQRHDKLQKKNQCQKDNFEFASVSILFYEVYYHTHGETLNNYG